MPWPRADRLAWVLGHRVRRCRLRTAAGQPSRVFLATGLRASSQGDDCLDHRRHLKHDHGRRGYPRADCRQQLLGSQRLHVRHHRADQLADSPAGLQRRANFRLRRLAVPLLLRQQGGQEQASWRRKLSASETGRSGSSRTRSIFRPTARSAAATAARSSAQTPIDRSTCS